MSSDVGYLLNDHRVNAILSWSLVGFLVLATVLSFLSNDLLWVGFALVVTILAVLPPALLKNARVALPWEVIALAALPVLGRSFATDAFTGNVATYFSIAAIALIVSVELDLFTTVRMTDSFAVALVVISTLATAGLWAVVRWLSDVLLGTTFLLDPALADAVVEQRLMWEFVASTAAGVLAGLIFALYVRRRIDHDVRFPEGMPR